MVVEVVVPNTALVPMVDAAKLAVLETQRTTIVEAAKLAVVDSPESLLACEKGIEDIKAAERAVHDELDPGCAKANDLHKTLTQQRKKFLDPLNEARRIRVYKTSSYRAKEERERREKETALRAKALKEAEDARLAEAVQLEEAGRTTEAEAVINERVKAPPVVVRTALPKPAVRYTTTWYAEVTDLWALIRWASASTDRRDYLMPNMTMLNGAARVTKDDSHIPGVEFRSRTT